MPCGKRCSQFGDLDEVSGKSTTAFGEVAGSEAGGSSSGSALKLVAATPAEATQLQKQYPSATVVVDPKQAAVIAQNQAATNAAFATAQHNQDITTQQATICQSVALSPADKMKCLPGYNAGQSGGVTPTWLVQLGLPDWSVPSWLAEAVLDFDNFIAQLKTLLGIK